MEQNEKLKLETPTDSSLPSADWIEDLKNNPRRDFIRAIIHKDLVSCLVKTAEIHGHFCPGIALGVMASVHGLNHPVLGSMTSEGMENLMAVVEINACFADGVQAVSGCTFGNNALVYRDLGRLAVTFAVRGKEKGVRIRVRPEFRSLLAQQVPEFFPLLDKVIVKRAGSAEEVAAFKEQGLKAAFTLIQLPFEELFVIEMVRPDLPKYAPITESVLCPSCGETIMSTKVVAEGKMRGMCFMCAGEGYLQVEGLGIVTKKG